MYAAMHAGYNHGVLLVDLRRENAEPTLFLQKDGIT
jgi:hypothetical protein